jgi:hypothetical protein
MRFSSGIFFLANGSVLDHVANAILVNVLALERRDLVQFQTIAIPRTTSAYVLVLAVLSSRESERFVIAVAPRTDCHGRRERYEDKDDCTRPNAAFHD